MTLKTAVGGENFAVLRRSGGYYVDKTELLYDLMEANNTVTLFTRPRRFGKTLTMRMLESFFSIFVNDSQDLFDGLAIRKHVEFCAENMNQYPTIFISLKDVEGRTFEVAYGMLRTIIADACKQYAELETADGVNPADAQIFHRLAYQTSTEEDIRNSIKTITRMMCAAYGKPVILLIDEYDVPLAKAFENGFYSQMLDVIRGIMSTLLYCKPQIVYTST